MSPRCSWAAATARACAKLATHVMSPGGDLLCDQHTQDYREIAHKFWDMPGHSSVREWSFRAIGVEPIAQPFANPALNALAKARFATEAAVRDHGGAVVLTISVGEEHTQVALTREHADALGLALLKQGISEVAFGGPPRQNRRSRG